MQNLLKKYSILVLLSLYFIAAVIILFNSNGTGENGSGDSVLHYLYSKYATTDFVLFLNHWAKPVFVLLSFLFAKMGIIGIKFFNIIVSLFTIFYTFKTAEALNYKNKLLGAIILIATPLYFSLTFSGLTEPLFALFTIFSTYLFIKNNYLFGAIILSFLPFVRSEGLIFIGVFSFFLLLKKQWKYIPFIITGHVVYSIIGYFHYHDFLWIFNKIPYAKLSSNYGNGELLHFVNQLFYVVGFPIYLLLVAGIIKIIATYFTDKTAIFNATSILIFGGFLTYFIAHSLFWYFGIFNSMGLKRVLIAVAPLIALIALNGFNLLTENSLLKNNIIKKSISFALIFFIVIFPFTSNKAALSWEKDFSLSVNQKLAKEVVEYLEKNENLSNKKYIFSNPYLSEILDINYFDTKIRKELTIENIQQSNSNDIIIWDNWFCIVENGISEEKIRSQSFLKEVKSFKTMDGNKEISYIIFVKE